jgi:hypothetical protein
MVEGKKKEKLDSLHCIPMAGDGPTNLDAHFSIPVPGHFKRYVSPFLIENFLIKYWERKRNERKM